MLIEQILPNCSLHAHDAKGDDRGCLIALEAGRQVPFEIKRVYFVYDTAPEAERGFHAHRQLQQWVVCTSGSCTISVDDGWERRKIRLDGPERGLYIGSGIWREMRDFSPGAVLMVLASEHFDEADYIRSYDEFLAQFGGPDA